MSETSYASDTDDSVDLESVLSNSFRDSSPFSRASSPLPDLVAPNIEPAPVDTFALMRLSPELRLNVYDQLLIDLTINRQRPVADLNKYHRAHEWPNNDFSAYLNLLLTCKEVHWHVKGLWEKVHIHKCCFYFWKLPDFHRVSSALIKLGEPYRSSSYALRTRASDEIGFDEAEWINDEGENCMKDQPDFPSHDPDYVEFQWSWPKFPYASPSGAHTLDGNGPIPIETYRQRPRGRKYARASVPGLEGCSLTIHDRQVSQSHAGTAYLLMSGEVSNVYWGEYDAAFGHSKQMIWDEWERRGFSETSLARADIVLSQRAQLEAGMAGIWVREGNKPHDHMDVVVMIEGVYNLRNWLRLRPSYAID
jgi:hypothetical protein